MQFNDPHDALHYHVSGAIERGEKEAITEIIASTDNIYAGAVITEDTHTSMHDHFWCVRHVPSYTRAWPIVTEAFVCEKCDVSATLLTQDDGQTS